LLEIEESAPEPKSLFETVIIANSKPKRLLDYISKICRAIRLIRYQKTKGRILVISDFLNLTKFLNERNSSPSLEITNENTIVEIDV